MSNVKDCLRRPSAAVLLLLVFLLAFLVSTSAAQPPVYTAVSLSPSHQMTDLDKSGAGAGFLSANLLDYVNGLEKVSVIVTFSNAFNVSELETVSEGQLVHTYQTLNGASVVMAGNKVEDVVALDGITGVYLDELHQLQMDSTPQFLGATAVWSQFGGDDQAGDGMLLATIDSGIWPEHPAFSDPDPAGNGYSAPANGPFACEFGNTSWNPGDTPFTCNNKLVGATAFLDTYRTMVGLSASAFDSARDELGHGSHTAAIAAGNGRLPSAIGGVDFGLISGMAPRAQIIAYKACGQAGCYSSDVVAAVEQAIADGVDAINYSASGGLSPYDDIVSLAFLEAYENGIFVAQAAGNDGPAPGSVSGRSPWVTTVGASGHPRQFTAELALTGQDGSQLSVAGVGLLDSAQGRVVLAADYDAFPSSDAQDGQCSAAFPANTWQNNELVVCRQGGAAAILKGYNVLQGGGGGMILLAGGDAAQTPVNHFVPTLHLNVEENAPLLAFLTNGVHLPVNGRIRGGLMEAANANVIPSFSSRGGDGLVLGVSKPDLVAPGVNVLTAHTAAPAYLSGGAPGELFRVAQGTSLAAPHVTGAALLLKQLHPAWTPGQIKSALMTTARLQNLVQADGQTAANHFDAGAGLINVAQAAAPGLTMNETAASFVTLKDQLWLSNYPSIYIPVMPGRMTVQRTLHSELTEDTWWRVRYEGAPDLDISGTPSTFFVPAGGDLAVDFTIDASSVPLGETRHGAILLVHEKDAFMVRIPVTIVRMQADVRVEHVCTPSVFPVLGRTDCAITIANNSYGTDYVSLHSMTPRGLVLVADSVQGATQTDGRSLSYHGVLGGAAAPTITLSDGIGLTPGYIPLAALGIPPLTGVGDESIVNFSLPTIWYADAPYTTIGMVSNGYLVMGGGDAGDVSPVNQTLPDPAAPNNVLAPFWTDLNPAAGGHLYAGILSDPSTGKTWAVFEWETVPNFNDGEANSFQVWMGVNGEEDITFVYGDVSDGDQGLLTVGAENANGMVGANWVVNGSGTAVANGSAVHVASQSGAVGQVHTISYSMTGWKQGEWMHCAEVVSNLFDGANIACAQGKVQNEVNEEITPPETE